MGASENVGFNAKVQQNLGLDFVKKTAQIITKTPTSLQLNVTYQLMLTSIVSLWLIFMEGYLVVHKQTEQQTLPVLSLSRKLRTRMLPGILQF